MAKWKPSKAKAKQFAETMQEIDSFCAEHGIEQSRTSDSYYFSIDGTNYISNHTVSASNRKAYDEVTGQKLRELYHPNGENASTVYITASKTRLIEIYNNLKSGKTLDRRGNVIC